MYVKSIDGQINFSLESPYVVRHRAAHLTPSQLSGLFYLGQKMKEIQLTRGKVTLVDDKDYERISQLKWYFYIRRKSQYAARKIWVNKQVILVMLHRDLLGLEHGDKMMVDHINGDGLDNRRSNLRLCTTSQNAANSGLRPSNTSGYKGVCWREKEKVWIAQICHNYKKIYLGSFRDREIAALAYNEAALKYHGEFARLNILEGQNDA